MRTRTRANERPARVLARAAQLDVRGRALRWLVLLTALSMLTVAGASRAQAAPHVSTDVDASGDLAAPSVTRTYRDVVGDNEELAPDITTTTVTLEGGRVSFRTGGPVLNRKGQIVAVVYAIERATGYGLAIPVDTLRALVRRGGYEPVPPCGSE